MVQKFTVSLHTDGKNEMIDITPLVAEKIVSGDIRNGCVLVFVPGSTGALSTIEYEPGLVKDFPLFMDEIIPQKNRYYHNETWHDGNGHSHLRATLVGPSLTIPVEERRMILGTWQQIVFLEFDNKPHHRKIILQLMGES